MDNNFTKKIEAFFATAEDQRDYDKGALLLLQITGNKIMYRNISFNAKKYAKFINYELQKPIKEDIKAEVIETMSDDFDPGKAREITFKHFEKAYPGFEQFYKEQYGEE